MPAADSTPPLGIVATVLVALAVSAVLLTHWERGFEHDPELRAHSGLIDAESDISLVRPENLGRALTTIRSEVPSGSLVKALSVTPAKVTASLVLASGTETYVTIAPGVDAEVRATEDRVSHPSGVPLEAIVPTAPERILLRAQRRFQLRPEELERLDLSPGADGGTWIASWSQPVDAPEVAADVRGGHVKRYGSSA